MHEQHQVQLRQLSVFGVSVGASSDTSMWPSNPRASGSSGLQISSYTVGTAFPGSLPSSKCSSDHVTTS